MSPKVGNEIANLQNTIPEKFVVPKRIAFASLLGVRRRPLGAFVRLLLTLTHPKIINNYGKIKNSVYRFLTN